MLPALAAARAPEPQTFERFCTIRDRDSVNARSHQVTWGYEHVCGNSDGQSWYMDAVAIGSRAYLVPYRADNVGVVDVSSGVFSTISTRDAGVTGTSKYVGAAAVAASVYFPPFDQDSVGVLDTASRAFSTIRIDGVTRGGQNYAGAVAVGTTVYMAPWNQEGVGVLDTVTSMFSTIDVGTAGTSSDSTGVAGTLNQYWGATALGTKVYFAPFFRDGILVLDTSTSALSTISTSADGTTYRGYASALVLGSNVYFLPRCESNIGVLETTSSTFSIINITQRPWLVRSWDEQYLECEPPAHAWLAHLLSDRPGPPSVSMAAVGTKIYFVRHPAHLTLGEPGVIAAGTVVHVGPESYYNHEVGVLDTVKSVFSTVSGMTTDQAYASAVAVESTVVFVPCLGDTVGMLQTESTTPRASGSSPTPDCWDAAASATSPLSLPHLAPSRALRLTTLQVALLSAGCILCACTVFGGLAYRASRRMAALRRSRDRAQFDLQLITRTARPHGWGLLGTPPVSLPNGPPSASAGGSAAGDAAVRGVGAGMSVTIAEVEQVLTLMEEDELEQVLVNEMPGLAQQDQQKRSAPPPEAAVDEAAGLLGGAHRGEGPQGKRQRQVVSNEASEGGVPQGCSSPGSRVDAAPDALIEESWDACSTSASRVLAAAHAHYTSVSGALDASSSSGSVLGRPNSTTANLNSDGASSVDCPSGQKGEMHTAPRALTPQPEKEAPACGGGRALHACKNCKAAKVTCVDGQRPCARCVRLGLPCEETAKPVKHACTNCSRAKVKCDLDAENYPCGRCRRFGLVCVPVEHTPSHEGRRKKRGTLPSGDGNAKARASGELPRLAP